MTTPSAEVQELRQALHRAQEQLRAQAQVAAAPTRVKDLTTANLIDSWRGEGPVPVNEFFENIERAAQVGNWTESDKVSILKLKLKGPAALFLNSNAELKGVDITFKKLQEAFVERFRVKQLAQFHYVALQNAAQHKNESPEAFADRCKRLCTKTIRQVADAEQQKIINEEAERRMLAAYTNGLFGTVGQQVRYRMPSTMAEAIQLAVTVASVEARRPLNQNKNVFFTQVTCFNCNRTGHIAKDCRMKPTNKHTLNRGAHKPGKDNKGSNNKSKIECYSCHKFGHIAKDCRIKKNYPNEQGSAGDSTDLSNWN